MVWTLRLEGLNKVLYLKSLIVQLKNDISKMQSNSIIVFDQVIGCGVEGIVNSGSRNFRGKNTECN